MLTALATALIRELALILQASKPILRPTGSFMALYGLSKLWECFGDRRKAAAYAIAGCALIALGGW